MDLTPDEQAELDSLAALARQIDAGDTDLRPPPPDVWDAVESALAGSSGGSVRPSGRARSGRTRWLVPVVGVAALVALVALGAWAVARSDGETVVGRAELEALDDPGVVVGEARLVDVDGELRLRIESDTPDPGNDGYLEVWLIDPDITELVSLGPARPDGTYDVPSSLDPARFPIVDISREPLDGDPTHAGDSVVQGQLDFT